jgi:hypothetical protein
MVFQAEVFNIKAYAMETTDNGNMNKNMCTLQASKVAVTTIDGYLINSRLVFDCPKSLMKPASKILHNKYKHQNRRN